MGKKKKEKLKFRHYVLALGLICFLVGTINGIRELFSGKMIQTSLAGYMITDPGGSKLELYGCRIVYEKSVKITYHKRRRTKERTYETYHLLEPKEKVKNPKTYVFVGDEYDEGTPDKDGYYSIKGWTSMILVPGTKSKMRELVDNKEADIVVISGKIKTKYKSITFPFLISLWCFVFLFVRAWIKTRIEDRRNKKLAKKNVIGNESSEV